MNNLMSSMWRALLALVLLGASAGHAADYPTKPVTVVIGYAAGGPTDVLMRAAAAQLSREWGQQIVVDNRPGANESIAAQYVGRSAPDGYTLLLCTEMPLTMNPYLFRKLAYDPVKDFEPVSLLLSSPLALVVNSALPVHSMKDFVELARSRAAGGKPMVFGSSGVGSVLHLPMVMLGKAQGLEFTHVPYKGVAPLVTDLIGGQIEAGWVAIAGAAPYVRDGRLRALVVDAPSRVKVVPDVPVFAETGVPRVQADFIFALMAPARTPADLRDKIAAAFKRVFDDPEFRRQNVEPFGYVLRSTGPAELARYLAADRRSQAQRITASGAQME